VHVLVTIDNVFIDAQFKYETSTIDFTNPALSVPPEANSNAWK